MDNISAVGIDLSKSVFQFHGVNHAGRKVFVKQTNRKQFLRMVEKLPRNCKVYVEASQGAHYWCREIAKLGYSAKQIAPQFVKPYVMSQKNDAHDADAICEAGGRPRTRFVATKNEVQQEIESLHRVRERLICNRTAIMNQTRGILAEHGVALPLGEAALLRYLADLDATSLSPRLKRILCLQQAELKEIKQKIAATNQELKLFSQQSEVVTRLLTIPGIGIISATALSVCCGDPRVFNNGRQFAAWLGLVPRQDSTAGKPKLLGISKRGDKYIRALLVTGAQSVIQRVKGKSDPYSLWVQKRCAQKARNVAAIALANKNARIAWRILTSDDSFDPTLPNHALRNQ